MCLVSFSKKKEYSSREKFNKWNGKTPIWAYIELTDYCSHKCSWCYGSFPLKDKKFLSLEKLDKVLSNIKQMGITQLSLGGGEPTEHPFFNEVLKLAKQYNFSSMHLLTHGDNLNAEYLKDNGITSVHMNYQGSKTHEKVHKSKYRSQLNGILSCLHYNMPLTASITVGAYNIHEIDDIVAECNNIGFERVRFWETTGVGIRARKDVSVREIFSKCKDASIANGYLYSHSYEPEFMEADINVPCIQVSNLGMYIDYQGMVKFCGATKHDIFITDAVDTTPDEILKRYLDTNLMYNCSKCEARNV